MFLCTQSSISAWVLKYICYPTRSLPQDNVQWVPDIKSFPRSSKVCVFWWCLSYAEGVSKCMVWSWLSKNRWLLRHLHTLKDWEQGYVSAPKKCLCKILEQPWQRESERRVSSSWANCPLSICCMASATKHGGWSCPHLEPDRSCNLPDQWK